MLQIASRVAKNNPEGYNARAMLMQNIRNVTVRSDIEAFFLYINSSPAEKFNISQNSSLIAHTVSITVKGLNAVILFNFYYFLKIIILN